MGCCGGKEDVVPDGEGGVVPNSTRKCRDVLCCLLFLVFWIGMAIVAILGLTNGEPKNLIYGTDFNGSVCGLGSQSSSNLTYYPRITQDMVAQAAKGIQPLDMKFYGLCVSTCPKVGNYICSYAAEAEVQSANPGATASQLNTARKNRISTMMSPDCWLVPLNLEIVAFRCLPVSQESSNSTVICTQPADSPEYYDVVNGVKVPNSKCEVAQTITTSKTIAQANSDPIMDKLQTTIAMVGRFVGDIQKTYAEVLVVCGVGSLILGWFFLFFMRCCAGCVIWLVLFCVVGVLAGLTLFFLVKGDIIHSSDISSITAQINSIQSSATVSLPASLSVARSNIKVYQAAAVISLIMTIIMLLIVCFMRKRIKIAIGIIKEASRTIQHMPLLVLFPVFPAVFSIILFIYTTVIGAYIYSANGGIILPSSLVSQLPGNASASVVKGWDAQLNATTSAIKPNQLMQIMIAYHVFGFLWTNQIIQAISMTTIAGAVCRHYWSREHTAAEMGRFPIASSLKNCFRYHFGSLAFGAFLIAVIQFIRMVLMYIDRQTKQLQNSNLAVKVAIKIVACCLWCLEKCIKFISKNAYIMIAMKGRSFCSSTKEAFMLIFANMAQIATTSMIINLVAMVGVAAIGVGCVLVLFLYLDYKPQFKTGGDKELNSLFPPCIIGFILAWFVGSSFIGVYEMCVDTILLCFCEDRRINKDTGKFYMSKELQAFVEKTSKKSVSSPKKPEDTPASPANGNGAVDV
ncbi:choline transporter [Thraustotheca clavata]|uniref:Choline transporter-like protein n=1 Tax=Thraustotheca clavata TaxID=74557 RepID=A0A1W0A830_9STRA|nr:choline transporter [Thraustotheca clavata]